MSQSYIIDSVADFDPNVEDNIMESILKQYEVVIIESLVTSFGLDFIITDKHGGDVDTVYNVRKIGEDENMTYKNKENQVMYNNRGKYDSKDYHTHDNYKNINKEIKQQKISGNLKDSYTGNIIERNGRSDLDHVISAKEIHDDPGRVLAGLRGVDLANCDENLKATNPHTNRTKKALSMEDFLNKYGDEYSDEEKANMKKIDDVARKSYELKLSKAYYTSHKFAKDIAFAAGKVSVKMGIRQVLGFIFAEVWFCIKEELYEPKDPFRFEEMATSIGNGIKRGFENAKIKYKDLLDRFKEGITSGALSSLTTTLCNIFFTTAKNIVKIIRQSYVSLIQAAKVLFINPDNLEFGDRMRATVKILSIGASVVVGTTVSELVGKSTIGLAPVVGDIVQTFCGTLVTGIMSCTLLYFLDRSELMNKLVGELNNMHGISSEVNYFRKQAEYFEKYAAELMKIDIDKFREETELYYNLYIDIEKVKNEVELNTLLKNILNRIGVKIPWEGDFDSFMNNTNDGLVFE